MITTLEIAMLTFMKKLSKEQIEKRKRLKEYFLKSLNIVSYILSALFIVVCIAVSVQSCNGKSKQQKTTNNKFNDINELAIQPIDNFVYSYTSKYSGDNVQLPTSVQNQLLLAYKGVSAYDAYTSSASTLYYNELLTNTYVYNYSTNEFVICERFYMEFIPIPDGGGINYYYRLKSIYLRAEGNGFGYCYKLNQDQTGASYNSNAYSFNNTWGTTYYNKFYCSDSSLNTLFFSLFFDQNLITDSSQIIFPNKLNYYYWINDFSYTNTIDSNIAQSIDVAKSNQFDDSQVSIYVYIDMPYFTSNGRLYNRIALNYLCLGYGDSARHFQNRNTEAGYDSFSNAQLSNFGLFLGMGYMNSNVDSSISGIDVALLRNVIYLPTYPYSTGSLVQVYTKEFTWQLPAYQKIQLLTDFPNESSLTSFELLISQSLNTASVNVYSSLFTLLGYAFASLKSIFDIQVMPMLSIGVLIFTPFLIGLIVIIFRMVKK